MSNIEIKKIENNRAKQFMPFDALKGFREALLLKDFEHEQIMLGEKDEDQIRKLTKVLREYEKGEIISLDYFENGHKYNYVGKIKIEPIFKQIIFNNKKILFENIIDINN